MTLPATGDTTSESATTSRRLDVLKRHNLAMETLFSAFNGIYMGLAIIAAPVVAVVGVGVSPLELTILVSAFPVGAFLGPFWAALGRRWGMKNLVTQMAVWANLPLLLLFQVDDPALFTALITVSQLMNSAMRMGQSSLYGVLYAREARGRVLGRLTFWTFLTMVPSMLATGWLLNKSREMYHIAYPFAGLCGLIGAWFYHQIQVPHGVVVAVAQKAGLAERFREAGRVLDDDGEFLNFQVAFFLCGSAFFMSTHVILLLVRERFTFSAFELSLWLSVMPQLLLALGSPFWGLIIDRLGIVWCRLFIGLLMTAYLSSYFLGIIAGAPLLIMAGSILQGTSNGGGQLTWSLASTHFAPRQEDVPLYNGIHFILNGIRGLVLPWIGAVLFVLLGAWTVLIAMGVALASVPVTLRLLRVGTKSRPEAMSSSPPQRPEGSPADSLRPNGETRPLSPMASVR